ncbi:hypothetical protein [Actinoallomurus sp. NPDC052274]|uniref:hypothetical protein n=1 Tax=Actinoallomurus sp. NPDC052274 TaxID=3155420 RepID=UPI0034376047
MSRKTVTATEAAQLQQLAERWPVGLRVRNKHTMWSGTIVSGRAADCPGAYTGPEPAHCFVPTETGEVPGAVCVQWDHPNTQPNADPAKPYTGVWPNPRTGPAWMRPGVLRPIKRERTSTRRAGA